MKLTQIRMMLLLIMAMNFAQSVVAEVPKVSHKQLEQTVSAIETAFAQSMADRDFTAFSQFVADDAVFIGGSGPTRGKNAILAAWKEYFEGQDAPFSWHPETVVVLDSGTLALSTGPVFNNEGEIFAYYNSTWQKNSAGQWQIIFDKGQAYCPPQTTEPEQKPEA